MKIQKLFLALILFTITFASFAQKTIYDPVDLNKVKFTTEDFGVMWTFDAVPLDFYKKELNFEPSQEWLDDVQKSALQFGNGCSGSFVSKNGLIMTNHHCVRGILWKIAVDGENIHQDGFYAKELVNERKVPDLFVDQLISINDVTKKIHTAMKKGKTDDEKIKIKNEIIDKIVEKKEKETGLKCNVITLYNGGKYSLYAYKRYYDIRLVMVPDVQIAATGWDWDNFTYPRYELDFAFLRAYENEKPVTVENYFTWSEKGADPGEPIFVIGRPGNTDRMLSYRELEYMRDTRNPYILTRLNEIYHAYYKYFTAHPENKAELLGKLLSVSNGRKSFAGLLMALNDDYLMAKKKDFEHILKKKVEADPKLKSKYSHLWTDIEKVIDELERIQKDMLFNDLHGYYASDYFLTALNMARYAHQMTMPEKDRSKRYKGGNLQETKNRIYRNSGKEDLQKFLTESNSIYIFKIKGNSDDLKSLYNGIHGKGAYDELIKRIKVNDKTYVESLIKQGPDAISQSDDPLIKYCIKLTEQVNKNEKIREQLYNKLDILNQELGRLIFETYGEQIPPDATSSLRIAHGVIKDYEYNGTIAPGKVTYYGLYDRFYSFGGDDYPWGLHERWKKPPEGLDLSIPICFASTNDIVGGNSGSAVINTKGEVVGLVHDGNLESLAGGYIYLPENNRSVATDSWGLMEALKLVYKTEKLVAELENK